MRCYSIKFDKKGGKMFWARKNDEVKEKYENMFSVLTTGKTKITGISGHATTGKERDARISITFNNECTLRFRAKDVEFERNKNDKVSG